MEDSEDDEVCKDEDIHNDLISIEKAMEKLKLVTFVSIFFIIIQCIGGYLSNSIAIYTDSAHLATDLIGFAMSITAIKMS